MRVWRQRAWSRRRRSLTLARFSPRCTGVGRSRRRYVRAVSVPLPPLYSLCCPASPPHLTALFSPSVAPLSLFSRAPTQGPVVVRGLGRYLELKELARRKLEEQRCVKELARRFCFHSTLSPPPPPPPPPTPPPLSLSRTFSQGTRGEGVRCCCDGRREC